MHSKKHTTPKHHTRLFVCALVALFSSVVQAQCEQPETVSNWRSNVSDTPTSNSVEDKYRYWYCNFRKYRSGPDTARTIKLPFTMAEADQHLYIRHYIDYSLVLLKETYQNQPAFSPNTLANEANLSARSLLILPNQNTTQSNQQRYDTLFRVINALSLIHERRINSQTENQIALPKSEIIRMREFYDFVSWPCILQSDLMEEFSKRLDRGYPFNSRMIQGRINGVMASRSSQLQLDKCNSTLTSLVL